MRAHRRGVKVVRQRHDFDCGVAALAMYLGVSYGDVALMARTMFGSTQPTRRGLGLYHLEAIAESIGRPLTRIYRRAGYLDHRSGVLGVTGGEMSWAGHWVVLKGGAIVDPDGAEVWTVEDYLTRHKTRPATLLVEA
jgi:hypothetical protein